MSPAIDQQSRLEYFERLIRDTRPDSVFACPTCGDAPLDVDGQKRALFSGVTREPQGLPS